MSQRGPFDHGEHGNVAGSAPASSSYLAQGAPAGHPSGPMMPVHPSVSAQQAHAPHPSQGAIAVAPPVGQVQPSGPALISLRGIGKTYQRGSETLPILRDLNLEIPRGGYIALMGPSGSGKSTLLNLIAGLDVPTSGHVFVDGKDIGSLSESQRAHWRAENVGFIFQTYNLLPVLTAVENVELPLLLTKIPSAERRKRAETALRVVGLQDRMDHYPRQLSGGQEQRVAIARAIVNDPSLIVADEPTGDLDRASADAILELLERLTSELGKTIVMVTHDDLAARRARTLRRMDKGALSV